MTQLDLKMDKVLKVLRAREAQARKLISLKGKLDSHTAGTSPEDLAVGSQDQVGVIYTATEATNKLNRILAAIRRIEKGTYGICQECGDPIAEARLISTPEALECIDCAERREESA